MDYCNEHGISHNFSTPRTPQQNGVVERKNRTLEEMARTMLIASGLFNTRISSRPSRFLVPFKGLEIHF